MRPRVPAGLARGIRQGVTQTGWGLAGLSASSAWLGARYHWTELTHLAAAGAAVLALGLVSVWFPRRARVQLQLRPSRVSVTEPAQGLVEVRAGGLPLVAAAFAVPAGARAHTLRPPLVTSSRPAEVVVELPTHQRGIVDVGPVTQVRSDLFGAFRRERVVTPVEHLYVRPAVVPLPSLSAGIVHDLEGVASDQLTASDLSFHALREYVPGDDPRHVHWKSTARAGSLLVRQFQLTRHSHASVVIDPRHQSYADAAEFELAVSAASSIALRAAQDGFDVAFACGEDVVVSTEVRTLLDLACRFDRGSMDLQQTCARIAGDLGGSSLVVTVTGSRSDARTVQQAVSHFPASAVVLDVRAEHGGEPRTVTNGTATTIVLAELQQLVSLTVRTRW